jgi:hypothetical protein
MGYRCLEKLLWTSIIHQRILIIFENSSKSFRHRIETHPVKRKMHIDTHSFIRSCSKKDLSFEWTKWVLTAFPKTSPIFQCPISIRCFIKHDQEYLLEYIQPPAPLLDYCFKARIWSILSFGHSDTNRLYWFYSYHRKTHWCIESISYSPLRLDSLLRFFQRSYDILTYLKDVPITSFVWRCRFDFLTLVAEGITINSMHCSVIFFWRDELPVVWRSAISTSSAFGAPSRRHFRLGHVYSAFHSLQASNLSTRWLNTGYL